MVDEKITDDVNKGLAQLEVLENIGTYNIFRVKTQPQIAAGN
jgi:hypothetical protein